MEGRTIFIRTVFRDVMEVVPPDNDGAGHLRRNDAAGQDTTANGNVAGEGALLVWTRKTA